MEFPVESLQQRLAHGLGVKGGSRGSLTRCVGRLGRLQRAVAAAAQQQGGNADATTAASSLLAREIQLLHVEMTKLALVARQRQGALAAAAAEESHDDDDNDANTNNTNHTNIDAQLRQARRAVQTLRVRHGRARATLACRTEYECLAKVAATRYPTPRRVLRERLRAATDATAAAVAESALLTQRRAVREGQFAALVQCLLDLKQSLAEPLPVDAATTRQKETDDGGNAMEVDKPAGAAATDDDDLEEQEEDDEEGALYEDL